MTIKEISDLTHIKDNKWVICRNIKEIPDRLSINGFGHIYIIEFGDTIKIGMTSDLKSRLKSLESIGKIYAGKNIGRIAYTLSHQKYHKNERNLHKYFSEHRIIGEFFNLNFDLIDFQKLSLDFSFNEKNHRKTQKEYYQQESSFYNQDELKESLSEYSKSLEEIIGKAFSKFHINNYSDLISVEDFCFENKLPTDHKFVKKLDNLAKKNMIEERKHDFENPSKDTARIADGHYGFVNGYTRPWLNTILKQAVN